MQRSFSDQLITAIDDFIFASFSNSYHHSLPKQHSETLTDPEEVEHVVGLMRINQVGEVCAQALYSGAKLFARQAKTYDFLDAAQKEELIHLSWCNRRLEQLKGRPSYLTPLYYSGAFIMGAVAGAISDKTSLGFVVETERQVEKHLFSHISLIPKHDKITLSILEQMKLDEAEHADKALKLGPADVGETQKSAMAFAASVMKTCAYYL
jgi:ubiquinone biosynthesis monooxygenase Coq7|tara:strand:+ start:11268 stop:11894 length:627 start_codon:yes stop_codon:yes gene_type:complete